MNNTPNTPLAPRSATADELRELKDLVGEDDGPDFDGACVAVFDGYCTDGPGYFGKVMTVIWPAGPEYQETFVWTDGALKLVEAD